MTGQTTNLHLPYPTGTDPVIDGDDTIKAIVLELDKGMIPFRMAAGSKLFTAAAVTVVSTAVAFVAGRFTFPPLVYCSIGNNPAGSFKAVPRAVGASTTGFTLYVYSGDQTAMTFSNLQVNWQAIQMLTDKANGGDA